MDRVKKLHPVTQLTYSQMLTKLKLSRSFERVAPLRKISLGQVAGPFEPHLGQQDITFSGFMTRSRNVGFRGGYCASKGYDFS